MGRRDALIEKFRVITGERVVKLNRGLVALEQDPDDTKVSADVAREIHTLKGEAKLLGFGPISTIAHKLEELMVTAGRSRFKASDPAVELVFVGFDHIERLRALPATDEAASTIAAEFVTRADGAIDEGPGSSEMSPSEPATASSPATDSIVELGTGTPVPTPTLTEARSLQGTPRSAARGRSPRPGSTRPGSKRRSHHSMETGIRVQLGRLEGLAGAADELLMSHTAKAQHLVALGHVEAEAQEVLRALRSLTTSLGRNSSTGASSDAVFLQKVAADALSTRNRQELLLRQLQTALRRLNETMAEDRSRVEGIEVEVRDLRLVPLARLFDIYPRAVRDLSRQLRKRVRLQVEGSDVEVDHAVLERIDEPLGHLIRNAVDHGVESPEERLKQGKPAEAVLRLSATQMGSRVLISVEDDGAGIDPAAVLARAKARGLVDQDVDLLLPHEAADILFVPGFSTKEVPSENSGRGVGLDVVKSRVEAMGGVAHMQSKRARFTRCDLSIPLSLVRAPTLVVAVGMGLYGLAPAHAPRVLLSEDVEIVRSAGGRAARIGGKMVRLAALANILGVKGRPPQDSVVVLLEYGDRLLAVEVDRIVTETHVIQHDLTALVGGNRMSAGTAVIGHGQLVVLLNVAELMRGAEVAVSVSTPPPAPLGEAGRRILVVDDSELTRDILVNLVTRFGFTASEAVDGQDALKRLSQEPFDLLLTDLEMPVLDGFALLERVRHTEQHKELPVVVCSTRGSDSDKRRAAHLGADAYVVKARFNEDELKTTLERFLGGRRP